MKSSRRRGSRREYPVSQRKPSHIKSKSGLRYTDIQLESLRRGGIESEDLTIDVETLQMQANVAEEGGYAQLASNLKRAAELVRIPNDRLLEIYAALRPRHSTFRELSEISDELLKKYKAPKNARFVLEAASAYRDAGLLLQQSKMS